MSLSQLTRLRELREHAGLSQAELARRIGVDTSLLSRWEKGSRSPSPNQQLLLARTLGITLDYLVNARLSVNFRFRAKKSLPAAQKSAISRALLDANMQLHYLDSIYSQSKRLPRPFSLRLDFSLQQLPALAAEIRKYLNLNRRLTFDELKQALTEFNVHIFEWALPFEISGLSCRDTFAVIFINRQHPAERRLFSLAHELAHLLFHLGSHTQTIVSIIASNRDAAEKEANAFAAELLMPNSQFEILLQKLGEKIRRNETLDNLAHYFNVSRDAIFYRLAERGVFAWTEKKHYFTRSEPKLSEPEARVTNIEEQIAPELLRLALDLYDDEQISAGKLTEYFFSNRSIVDEFLERRSAETEEEALF